jgi:hypothetical protein
MDLDEYHRSRCCDNHDLHHLREPSECWTCREVIRDSMHCLAHNLVIAGALCAAFWQGHEQREHEQLYSNHGYRTDEGWRPGCGRAAKGRE